MAYFAFMAFITGFNLIPGFSWRLNNISAFHSNHSEKTFILKIRELRWKTRSLPANFRRPARSAPTIFEHFVQLQFSPGQWFVLIPLDELSDIFPNRNPFATILRIIFFAQEQSPGRTAHSNPGTMEFVFCFWQLPKSSNNLILSGCSISNGITYIWGLLWFSYAKLFRGQLLKKIFWGFYCASRHS